MTVKVVLYLRAIVSLRLKYEKERLNLCDFDACTVLTLEQRPRFMIENDLALLTTQT